MNTKTVGWALFFNEACDEFSSSFQEQLSAQLLTHFETLVEQPGKVRKRGFGLLIGLHGLNTTVLDNSMGITINITSPDSSAWPTTAYWQPTNSVAPNEAPKLDDWTTENIQFYWGKDFNQEQLKAYFQPRKKKAKQPADFPFDLHLEPALYPDLTVALKTPSALASTEIDELSAILQENMITGYASAFQPAENGYMAMLDFEQTAVTTGLKQLDDFLQALGKNALKTKITAIAIE